jgi:hypothetical protein
MFFKYFSVFALCMQSYAMAETAKLPVPIPTQSDKAVCWSGNDVKQVQILTRDGKGLMAQKKLGGNFILVEGKALNQDNFVSGFKMISKIGGGT